MVLFIVAVWFILVCYAAAIALVVGALYLLVRHFTGAIAERDSATEQRSNASHRRPATQQGGGWLDSDAPDQFNIPRGGWKSGR